jgi:hypothetical protein
MPLLCFVLVFWAAWGARTELDACGPLLWGAVV